jgi:hypothetical protein
MSFGTFRSSISPKMLVRPAHLVEVELELVFSRLEVAGNKEIGQETSESVR